MSSYLNALTSDAPSPLNKVVYLAEKDFFPQEMYERSIKNVLTMLNPSKSSYIYRAIQALYKDNPNRFSIFSGLHQNHDTDVLHYSVLVRLEHRCNIILHFNGYYKNFFIVKNITINEETETKMIADFTFIPLEPV
jgi:hypothetical protein